MKKISILFVCLGNICRSPAAEAIFLDLLAKNELTDCFQVDSAGTGSWHIGKKADFRMRIAAENRGLNILSRSRQINKNDFENEMNSIKKMMRDILKEEIKSQKDVLKAFDDLGYEIEL